MFRRIFLLTVPAFVTVALAGSPNERLQIAGPGIRVQPLRAASYTHDNGRIVRTSDWIPLTGSGRRGSWEYVWDCLETDIPDPNGCRLTGYDVATDGCSPPPNPSGDDRRWYYGPGYRNPFVRGDILDAYPRGQACDGVGFAWNWDETDMPCFVAVGQWEDFDADRCRNTGSGFIDGVLYDFGRLTHVPGEFFFAALDLSGTGVVHTMPADGDGGVEFGLFDGIDPNDGSYRLAALAQPMLWGAGRDETIPDGRVGDQSYGQFDDDNPTDGVHNIDLECYDYRYGVCPNPLGICIGFMRWRENGPCAHCVGDLTEDGAVDLGDLSLLLQSFGASAPDIPSPCADLNDDRRVDLSDLALMLSNFSIPCP